MMNFEDIIARKIQYLNGETSVEFDDKLRAFIDVNPELKAELSFIESLWQSKALSQEQQPSASLDARFYQMLSQAQSYQNQQEEPLQNPRSKPSWIAAVWNAIALKPVAQFAVLVLVFFTGWNLNTHSQQPAHVSTAKLEEQVSTLNAMVAMTMLQHHSATERLAGVGYSALSSQSNSRLSNLLLELLATDNSSAVRLAIVDALGKRNNLANITADLFQSISKQSNPLVQMSLVRLAIQKQLTVDEETLVSLINDERVDYDVKEYIRQYQVQLMGGQRI